MTDSKVSHALVETDCVFKIWFRNDNAQLTTQAEGLSCKVSNGLASLWINIAIAFTNLCLTVS